MAFLALPEAIVTTEMEEYIVTHSRKRKKKSKSLGGDRAETIFSKTYRVAQVDLTPEMRLLQEYAYTGLG